MMICSYLHNKDIGFIHLHAEQAYTHISESALNSVNLNTLIEHDKPNFIGAAIHTEELTITTIVRLKKCFSEMKEAFPKYLLIDFDSISFIQKNLKAPLQELNELLNENKSQLILLNYSDEIESTDGKSELKYFDDYEKVNKDYEGNLNGFKYDYIIELKEVLFKSKKEEKLVSSFEQQNPPFLHESSSVYLSQYFNFKRYIAEDFFVYYSLYRLALKMLEQNKSHSWAITPYSKTVLFCQTLNGSFIGSILADLLGIDIYLVDHLGPINKIYTSKLHSELDISCKYIVISDVLCLGTEVKNSKSIIEFSGAKYLGNVSFLRIESRKKEDIDFKDIEFFYRIDKDYNPVNYKIITDLD